jgi:hypothetical protein
MHGFGVPARSSATPPGCRFRPRRVVPRRLPPDSPMSTRTEAAASGR